MHYSDDALLLLIEGELGWLGRAVAERHLARCMRCRARAQAIRSAMDAAAFQLTREQIAPPPAAAAKLRFRQWERSEGVAIWLGTGQSRGRWTGFAAATVAAAALAVAFLFLRPVELPPDPASLLQASVERESSEIGAEATEQWLALSTTNASGVTEESRIEIVSDPPARRFVWRRFDAQGALRHAAWKPAGGDYYVFEDNSVRATADWAAGPDSLSSARAPLEQRVLEWILHEPWRAVRLADRFAQYAGRKGAILTVGGAGSHDGRRVYSLRVSFAGSPLTLTMEILEAAPGAKGPAVTSLKIVERDSGTTVTVRPKRIERLGGARLAAVSFVPGGTPPRKSTSGLEHSKRAAPAPSQTPAPLQDEVRLYHALFQSGALQQGEVSIQPANSGLLLEGVVRDEARRSQILSYINPAAITAPLEIRLLTENEARESARPGAAGQIYRVAPARTEHAAPWQKAVAEYYRSLGVSDADLPSRVAGFGGRLVRHSAAALASAWAIQRIDQRFSAAEIHSLPHEEQAMLAEMKRQLCLSASRSLEEIESELARVSAPSGERLVQSGVFEAIRLLDEEINALVAGESADPASQTVTLGRVLSLARTAAVETKTTASRLADEAARLRPPR